MNRCPIRLRKIPSAAITAIALLLAGCGDIPGLDTVTGLFSSSDEKASSSIDGRTDGTKKNGPIKFTLGDRYTFDNPVERWEVVAIKGEKIYWRSDLGERQITGFDPLLPPLEWYSRSKGKGRRLIRDKEGALFPIRVGASLKFRATVTTDMPPFGWEHDWECRVTDEKTLETLGGPFEIFVVKCGHGGAERITYHYAPKVGNYLVRLTKRSDGKPDSVRNLLSFERAGGTVVAGIVVDRRAQSPKRTAAATPIGSKKLPSPKLAAPTVRPINPKPGSGLKTADFDAIASLGLTEPKFGGRAAPPEPVAVKVPKTEPRAATKRAEVSKPVPPPPKPKTAAPPPNRLQTAKRSVKRPTAQVLGPRAASPRVKFVPRARVPVPPPPLAKKPVPVAKKSAPAAKKPVPVAKNPAPAAQKLEPEIRKSRVPPPPIVVKAPVIPKASIVPPAVPVAPNAVPANSVHLASYRSAAAAKKGWTELLDKNDDLLGPLKSKIRKIEVAGKGTYFRLYAGPVSSSSTAVLCRELNSRGVFCSPAS